MLPRLVFTYRTDLWTLTNTDLSNLPITEQVVTLNVRNTVEKYRGNSDGMQYTVVFLTDQEYQDAVRDAKPYFDEEGEGKFQAYIGWGKSNLMEGGKVF